MATTGVAGREAATLSLDARQIVTAGILGAIAIVLGVTRLGFIPVPNLSGNATIMHVPAIIGGAIEGPIVGALAGGIFGVFSWVDASIPLFKDPIVAVVPRVLIGIVAWAVFAALKNRNLYVASVVAGVLGSATNTVGVLGLGVILNYLPAAAIPPILPQATAEAVIAAVITVVVVKAVDVYRSGRTTAPEIAAGKEQRY